MHESMHESMSEVQLVAPRESRTTHSSAATTPTGTTEALPVLLYYYLHNNNYNYTNHNGKLDRQSSHLGPSMSTGACEYVVYMWGAL